MLHPPKKTGVALHPYFPITVTSLQRPFFLCPQGGCRRGSGEVKRFNSLAIKRRPNVNDIKNNLNIIGHFGGEFGEAF